MKIFMMIFVFTTFSTLSMGLTPEQRANDEFSDAKIASEVMLYKADKLKAEELGKDIIKSNRIGKSILGRYIDKKILEVKKECKEQKSKMK